MKTKVSFVSAMRGCGGAFLGSAKDEALGLALTAALGFSRSGSGSPPAKKDDAEMVPAVGA